MLEAAQTVQTDPGPYLTFLKDTGPMASFAAILVVALVVLYRYVLAPATAGLLEFAKAHNEASSNLKESTANNLALHQIARSLPETAAQLGNHANTIGVHTNTLGGLVGQFKNIADHE